MNRIRRVGNVYQCLLSPHHKYNTGMEHLLGFWNDESMIGFDVKTFLTYNEAECEAYELPDINWDRLVTFHKEPYIFLRDKISKAIDDSGLALDFKHYLASPIQTKNRMFDRIIKGKKGIIDKNITSKFRTSYNMNDIISFVIINPWYHNLKAMADNLIRTDELQIFKKIDKNGTIHLIGRTCVGTSYEILLVTSVIHNWMMWKENSDLSPEYIKSALKNCLKTQQMIDSTPYLK